MYKKFFSYYKNHKLLFTIDMFSALMLALIDLLIPAATAIFIDTAIPNNNQQLMITISIILLVSVGMMAFFNYIVTYYGHVMGTRIEKDMRDDLFSHFHKMDCKFFTERKVGELMSRLTGDLRDISEFAHHGPEDLFISAIMLVGSFIILFNINVLLSSILLLILFIMALYAIFRRRKMAKSFKKTRKFQANLNGEIENSLSGINVVKSYTNEPFEIEKFQDSNEQFQESWGEAYFEMGVFSTVMTTAIKLMSIVVIIVGGFLALNGKLTIGELTGFLLYVTFFTSPLRRLIGFVDQYQKGWSGYSRFYDMLHINEDIKSGTKEFTGLKNEIKFDNITFDYEGNKVLKDFSLDIKYNTSVAIVGKTGVGKSTIVKLIPRFFDVASGKITFDGTDIKDFNLQTLRDKIGYVEQDNYIFFGTIADNIRYGNLDATDTDIEMAAKMASLDEFVQSLPNKYDTQVGSRGIKLSGGQKQRISLARMFLKNPDILVLDEATSALDNKTELEVQRAIHKLSKSRTSIIIAHRLTTIMDCDYIYLLDSNGIAEYGNHNELMELKGEYYDMFTSAQKLGKLL